MNIHGVIPPLLTPLTARDELDVAGLERLLEHVVAGGVHGIFVLGTTGEGPSLSYKVRRDLISNSARILNSRVPLYVGITDTSLVEALHLADFSSEHGAKAVVAAAPFYFPAGQTELTHWYNQLLDDLPLPLILYNMPGCTKIEIAHETMLSLMHHDKVVGMKDSSGDWDYLAKAIELAAKELSDWPVLVGPEHLLADTVRAGGAGGVAGGANLAPRLYVDLYEAAKSGDEVEVQRLQAIVMQLQELYQYGKYGSSVVKGLKCVLEMRGICSGLLAAPFDVFLEPERQKVIEWMQGFGETGYLPESSRR